jgi:precorrin-3B synthase
LRAASPFDLRRMQKLIAATGVAPVIERAGVTLSAAPSVRTHMPSDHLGVQDINEVIFAGVAAPSGRWRVQELAMLAEAATAHGLGEARLTPWRAILIPASHRDAAGKIIAQAAASGLIVASDDPRRSIVACPGAPECLQAQGETRIHLERLAPLARQYAGKDGVGLHISGCGKGCACQGATPITLVLAEGRFNLVVNGGAQDAPIRAGLALDEIEPALTHNVRNMAPCPAN